MMPAPFPSTSRYSGIETTTLVTVKGKTIVYLQRRFIPSPERFSLIQEHTVTINERLDNITAKYLGDPEQFWRICDANNVMKPDELVETTGRKIRITLPEGIPGAPNV
jgi:hypothetical protein